MSDATPTSSSEVETMYETHDNADNSTPIIEEEQNDENDEDIVDGENVQNTPNSQPMDIETSPTLPKLEINTTQTTQTTPGLTKNGPCDNYNGKSLKGSNGDDDDESSQCPICFEAWTNSGDHRLVSLPCGHLFGRKCVLMWLKEPKNKYCPQCKTRARTQDVRNLYATSLKALDTTEKEEIKKNWKREEAKRKLAENQQSKAELQIQLMRNEMELLKKQVEEANTRIALAESKNPGYSINEVNVSPKKQPALSQTLDNSQSFSQTRVSSSVSSSFPKLTKGYSLKKTLQVSQKDARVLAFDKQSMIMVVSKPSPNQLFAGHGVLKVSSLESRSSEYIPIHTDVVRDAKFNHSGDNLLLTGSLDKTLKITNVLDRSTVFSHICPSKVWACSWNENDTNYIYAGLQNGVCLVFDIRNNEKELFSLRPHVTFPIISLSYVPSDNDNSLFKCEGLLVGTIQGGWFVKKESDSYSDHQLIIPEGACLGISFEPRNRYCLLSQRPGKKCSKVCHTVLQLGGEGTTQSPIYANMVKQGFGGNRAQALTRSFIYTTPEDHSRLMFAAGDEASSSVFVWDGVRGDEHQKLSCGGGSILDVMVFEAYESQFLAALTDQKLHFYQWGV